MSGSIAQRILERKRQQAAEAATHAAQEKEQRITEDFDPVTEPLPIETEVEVTRYEPTYWFNPERQQIQKALTQQQENECKSKGWIEFTKQQADALEEKMFNPSGKADKVKEGVVETADEVAKKEAIRERDKKINPLNFREVMEAYPRFLDLKKSELWNRLNLAARIAVSREYTKHAQLAAMETHKAQRELEQVEEAQNKLMIEQTKIARQVNEAFNLNIKLNDKQDLAVVYALEGKCFVMTGAAGTGKTTAARGIAEAFIQRGNLGYHTFKREDGTRVSAPGIAFVSYTRRATANIRRALHKDPELEKKLYENVVTIHRLLEYEPEFYEKLDEKSGEMKPTMRFIPKRTKHRPLDIKVLVIEEGSMLGLDLWEKLYDAMKPGTIVVFIGDINQLPPVFGKSIMNYALAQLPVIELTEVYRQALDSGIIVNAHRILKGEPPVENKDTQIVTGKSPTHVGQEKMARALGGMFFQLWQAKEYDPEQDIILSPWNKQPCGTDNLNAWIAQFLGESRNAMVYEVFAGRRKLYVAVGDRVMYEKRDGIITAIRHNAQYLGKAPQTAGNDLTRFGLRKLSDNAIQEDFEQMAHGYESLNIDEVPDEEKKQQASHTVTLRLDDGSEETLSAIGDFSEQVFSLGYALTVHKAQGCEWRRVYVVLHKDHTMGGFLTRELVYTACTRARERLILIAKHDTLAKAVKQQTIKGNTLEEKIASINSGASNIGSYPVVKRL